MFTFHNKVKRHLYDTYLFPKSTLVELGCGKGGDLHKAVHNKVSKIIAIDVDRKHLQEFRQRYETKKQNSESIACYTEIDFLNLDLREAKSWHLIKVDPCSVQCVSSQFSLHYLWGDRKHMQQCFQWIQYALELGGFFIGSVPDADSILWVCGESGYFRNSIAEITLTKDDATQNQHFGRKVCFRLKDSIIDSPTGSHEFLVFYDELVEMAKRYGLRIVASDIFDPMPLSSKLQSSDIPLSSDQRQITTLNRWFVFQKVQLAPRSGK